MYWKRRRSFSCMHACLQKSNLAELPFSANNSIFSHMYVKRKYLVAHRLCNRCLRLPSTIPHQVRHSAIGARFWKDRGVREVCCSFVRRGRARSERVSQDCPSFLCVQGCWKFIMCCVFFREEIKEKSKNERTRKIKKYTAIGAATVGGGVLLGYSYWGFSRLKQFTS